MKTTINRIAVFLCTLAFVSCATNPSLQKYYIDNSDDENFISMDIPVSVFSLKENAPEELTKALATIDKFVVLAFVKKKGNEAAYSLESKHVNDIMKNDKYQELIRVKHQGSNVVIKYEGAAEDETLNEVVLYASDKNMGFALVRILGDEMNPSEIMQFAKHMDVFNFDSSELEGIFKSVGQKIEDQ